MNRDTMQGAAKDLAGKVQRKVGQATDDPAMAAKGAAKQAEGKLQKGVGKLKDAAERDRTETRDTTGSSGTGRKGTL